MTKYLDFTTLPVYGSSQEHKTNLTALLSTHTFAFMGSAFMHKKWHLKMVMLLLEGNYTRIIKEQKILIKSIRKGSIYSRTAITWDFDTLFDAFEGCKESVPRKAFKPKLYKKRGLSKKQLKTF